MLKDAKGCPAFTARKIPAQQELWATSSSFHKECMMMSPQLSAEIAAAKGLPNKVRGTDICSFAKLLTASLHPEVNSRMTARRHERGLHLTKRCKMFGQFLTCMGMLAPAVGRLSACYEWGTLTSSRLSREYMQPGCCCAAMSSSSVSV